MIVSITKYPDENTTIKDSIDCDKAHQVMHKEDFHLILYKGGKIIHDELFTEKAKVFFMEQGKTVDRMDFKVNA